MKWADYYERYDGWQSSTQYSRLSSISDFGPEGSPSDEIADCIQYVDTRTATSIIRRALAAGVLFRTAEITDIVDSGQIEDDDLLEKLILACSDEYTGEQNVVVSSGRHVDFAQHEQVRTASATVGKYDNYDNRARIKACEKKLAKLKRKKKPNQFEINQAQKRLDEAKLFQSCQIFKSSIGESLQDPNDNIMFSDSNEVLWFGGVVIRYRDLRSYSLIENVEKETRSKINKARLVTAAVMGEIVLDSPFLGMALAKPDVKTTTYQRKNGFQLCVKLKNGAEYSIPVLNAGFFKNKASKRWYQVCERLDEIIERYK